MGAKNQTTIESVKPEPVSRQNPYLAMGQTQQSLMVVPMKATMRMPPVRMGLFDGMGKADSSSAKGKANVVKATYKGNSVDAKIGSKLKPIAAKLDLPVEYACETGQCGTCESKLNGRKTRICVAKVPNKDFKLDKMGWF